MTEKNATMTLMITPCDVGNSFKQSEEGEQDKNMVRDVGSSVAHRVVT